MGSIKFLTSAGQPSWIVYVVIVFLFLSPILYYGSRAAYNLWFHPLSKYPGPKLAAASTLWYVRSHIRGTTPIDILKLHNKYGPVVRVAPDELSFVSPTAWKEIYGHKKPGQPELTKDKKYHAGFGAEPILINSNREYHAFLRKQLAHGFSDSALREQESVIQENVNILMARLHEHGKNGQVPLDMVVWYNYFTFDVIGYLAYGESFGCLSGSKLHAWVEVFFHMVKILAYAQVVGRLPGWCKYPFLALYTPPNAKRALQTEDELSREKVKHRLQISSTIPDFMGKLVDCYEAGKMSFNQLNGNAKLLVGAGSETTATLLAGVTWLLMDNPRTLNRLTQEIRTSFQDPEEITMTSVNSCKYLLACLEEALRVYPPSPATHPRYVPPGGMAIDGHFVPEDMAVGIAIYASCNSPLNFRDPDQFIPERWTGEDPAYSFDKKEAAQVFSFGPRNCIGRNLAYVEMKLIIARLVWHFDLENATEGNWRDQKIFMVWEKAPLMVRLKPVTSR